MTGVHRHGGTGRSRSGSRVARSHSAGRGRPWCASPSLCSSLSNLCETDLRARRCQVVCGEPAGRRDTERLEAGVDRFRWGVLSTARIATEKVIPGIRRSTTGEVVAIASRDGGRARAAADGLGIPRSHGSYEALLADPGVDAVYVPLPNHLHAEWSIRAMEAGKHVLCEKPLALSAADARPDGGRCGGVGTAPDGGLHVPPPPQLGRGGGARCRWPDRAAPGRRQLVLLLPRRSGQHPQRARVRRWSALRHRLLLREPLAPAVRRGAWTWFLRRSCATRRPAWTS